MSDKVLKGSKNDENKEEDPSLLKALNFGDFFVLIYSVLLFLHKKSPKLKNNNKSPLDANFIKSKPF